MGTISSAMSLISAALNADQAALSIVAGNVANANTPGYTEEIPTWRENTPVSINGATYGTGATMTGATSRRDRVLESRIDQQKQLEASSAVRLQALNTAQTLFLPDSGAQNATAGDIGSDLTKLFSSFSSLEAAPTNNALRQQVLSASSTLASDVSNAARSLSQQRVSLDQSAASIGGQVNALSSSISKLNVQIQALASGHDAGPLEDQRQQAIAQLSQLVGIHQITTENDGLALTTASGQTLVSQGQTFQMTTQLVNGDTHFLLNGTDITSSLSDGGGKLGGYLAARDKDIPGVLAGLDQLAFTVSTQVNAQNAAGTDLNGGVGAPIFAQPVQAQGSAMKMSVVMADPNGIAAASFGKASGDNGNAIALANLSSTAQALLNGQTPSSYFAGFVTQLGSSVQAVQTENSAQNGSISQLQTQRNALSSVNLNDEAAAITTLQRSYQAASQVFNLLDKLMATVLNLGQQTAVS